MSSIQLMHGDCMELLQTIPDNSVDLVLCDLPYNSLKSIACDGWKNKNVDVSWDISLNIDDLFNQYHRICRQNAAILLFSKEPLTTKIRTSSIDQIKYHYSYIWKKQNFSNPYVAKKVPLSVYENIDVFFNEYTKRSSYDEYRFKILEHINESRSSIIKRCGQSVDHFFRTNTKQFISEKGYNKLIDIYHIDKFSFYLPYKELDKLIQSCRKIFNIPDGSSHITDVLEFNRDISNYHPTQKPVDLLEFLINVYSNEGDTVVDNCMGSGSTGIACIKSNRNFIGIEINSKFFKIAEERIHSFEINDLKPNYDSSKKKLF